MINVMSLPKENTMDLFLGILAWVVVIAILGAAYYVLCPYQLDD